MYDWRYDAFKKHSDYSFYETIFDFDYPFNGNYLKSLMKDNIFIVDIPGFTKNDIDVEFDNNILSVYLKDDDKTYKWKITEGFKIESAKCIAGQLIIKFIKIKKEGTKIVVE
jgi:hypothetical protein